MSLTDFVISDPFTLTACAFAAGLWCSLLAWKCLHASRGMLFTAMALPALVCAALLAINGSLGTGIAILGVFGLIRFRSMPGSGPDIVAVFLGMVSGLLISTGRIVLAGGLILLLGILLAAASWLVQRMRSAWVIRILVPENTESFETYTSILKKYGRQVQLARVRSMNMGTMYELEYTFVPARTGTEEMLEQLRIQNHNLNVQLSEGSPDMGL